MEIKEKEDPGRRIDRRPWMPGSLIGDNGMIYEPDDDFEIEVADEVRKYILNIMIG